MKIIIEGYEEACELYKLQQEINSHNKDKFCKKLNCFNEKQKGLDVCATHYQKNNV